MMERKTAYFFTRPEERGDTMHVELRIDGVTYIDSELDFYSLLRHVEVAEEIGVWYSTPLTLDEAKDLLSQLEPKHLELVRQIVLRGGCITMQNIAKICGIPAGDLDAFVNEWIEPINKVVDAVKGEVSGSLIRWKPDRPDWGDQADEDRRFYIDGPALQSLTKALLGP